MSDRTYNASAIPWSNLVMMSVLIGGLFLALPPLKSSRPATVSSSPPECFSSQRVDARLWQDPIGAICEYDKAKPPEGRKSDGLSELQTKMTDLHKAISEHRGGFLVLPVMLTGSPYPEYVEERIRRRQAVLEALGVTGLVPEDGSHLGYFELTWPPAEKPATCAEDSRADPAGQPADARPMLVPYEWWATMYDKPVMFGDLKINSILVLWLQEAAFMPRPLWRLGQFVATIRPREAELKVRVLAPSTSEGLREMLSEAVELKREGSAASREKVTSGLDGVSIWAATPTAADAILKLGLDVEDSQATVEQIINGVIGPGQFCRTMVTDDKVMNALIDELSLRGVEAGDHIAVISEWDTFYGRALPLTFAAVASGTNPSVLAAAWDPEYWRPQRTRAGHWPDWIHYFSYLRGIDGLLPGKTETDRKKSGGNETAQERLGRPVEPPEGVNQLDYLRRLAGQLEELHARLQYEGRGGLKAVGVLGSDVYDKLLVLRALRSARLPGVVFFTNKLDARMSFVEEWAATRNVVVASPYGLTLYPQFQRHISPFRDSSQTAVFAATLRISGFLLPEVRHPPRVYEIGRNGPHEFTPIDLAGSPLQFGTSPRGNPDASRRTDENSETLSRIHLKPLQHTAVWNGRRIASLVAAVASAAILLLLLVRARRRILTALQAPEPPLSATRLGRLCARVDSVLQEHRVINFLARLVSSKWFPLGSVLFCCLLLLVLHWTEGPSSEPVSLTEGISMWPSLVLRLFAGLLCIHCLFKASANLSENCRYIEDRFKLGEAPDDDDENGDAGQGDTDARRVWKAYLEQSGTAKRLSRFLPAAAIYFVLVLFLTILFGLPSAPYRGSFSNVANLVITVGLAVVPLILLIFDTIDFIMLDERLTRTITPSTTAWPPALLKRYRQDNKEAAVDQDCLADYLDVRLIAEQTKLSSRLVRYPFAALFLLIVSRFAWFDNWDWPVSIIIALSLNSACVIYSICTLRHAAEDARRKVLRRLRDRHTQLVVQTKDKQAAAVKGLISEVESERRGAFAPFWQHPALTAILLPSAGIIWAFVQSIQ